MMSDPILDKENGKVVLSIYVQVYPSTVIPCTWTKTIVSLTPDGPSNKLHGIPRHHFLSLLYSKLLSSSRCDVCDNGQLKLL